MLPTLPVPAPADSDFLSKDFDLEREVSLPLPFPFPCELDLPRGVVDRPDGVCFLESALEDDFKIDRFAEDDLGLFERLNLLYLLEEPL